jgi:RNA polymerase primary sigma factor
LSDIVQPANRFRINSLLKTAKVQLNLIGIVEPSDEELVDQYMTIKDAKDPVLTTVLLNEIRNNSKSFVSSHATLSGTEDFELQDTFKTSSDFNTDNNIVTTEKKESIVKTLTQLLGERDANIVMLHFGLNGNDEMTLEQIADRMGYTRERIGQLVQNCIKKLTPHKKLMFELLGSSKETSHSVETNHLNYAVKTM